MSAILLRVQYSGVLLRRRKKKTPKKREHDNLKKRSVHKNDELAVSGLARKRHVFFHSS